MAERKPCGMPWETWIDRQIREAEEKGELDGLPGQGKPIPGLDLPYDELWWVKGWLKREGIQILPQELEAKLEEERRRGKEGPR